MKTKKLKAIAAVMLGVAMSFSAFAFVGCGPEENEPELPPVEDVTNAKVEVSLDKTGIKAGTNETVTATATVTELTDTSVVWSLEGDGASYADISADGVVTLKANLMPKIDMAVTVVATSTVSASVKGSATLIIEAQVIKGQVGELTTEMFQTLGNASITVSGEVSDVYDDLENNNNDSTNSFDFTVKMSDGAWYGEWNRKNSKDKDINNYRRSDTTIAGTDTHTFNQVYIDKDNKIAQKAVTDYNSVAAVWENQHMWNHLAQLGTDVENQWKYDAVNKVYMYQFDNKSVDDLYLRAYLAVSLTPMLTGEDTLESIALVVDGEEDNKRITKMIASTTVTYYGAEKEGDSQGATALSYTTLTAEFTEVGTTSVPDPTPYEAPRHADVLEKALKNMGDATNYTFRAMETTLSAPTIDDDDYSEYSVSTYRTSASDSVSSTGTVGLVGRVTEDAILLARTGEYTSSMDGNNFWTEYSGYKQLNEDTYDYFEFDSSLMALAGKRQYKGNIFDNMPKFQFSANIFEYAGMSEVKINDEYVGVYNFTLREPAVTRDIAMQVSAHSNASSATGATHGTFKITVMENGTVVSTEYPYSLVVGTYLGIVKTTYSSVGTTTLPEDTFDEYAPRVLRDSWSQVDVRYYYPTHTTQSIAEKIDAGTLFNNIFGNKAQNLPSPTAFYNAFGDSMTDAFFEWDTEDNTATGGIVSYHDYVSFNLSIDECDENSKVSKEVHDKYIRKLTDELKKYNFAVSGANTGVTSGDFRYTTYISENGQGNIMIKIENIGTRFFYVDILPVGLWTLNK